MHRLFYARLTLRVVASSPSMTTNINDLGHDLFHIVLMQLGHVSINRTSRVCQRWNWQTIES